MSDITFIDKSTVVPTTWLQDVNNAIYRALGSAGVAPTTAAEIIANLGLAVLASPVFTGNPTSPTPSAGDADTSIATTLFVATQAQNQQYQAFTTTGTQPNFVLTPSPAISSYTIPQRFRVKFHTTGTLGSNTLNISGLGGLNLKQYDGTGVKVPAYIFTNLLADVEYDGTDLLLRGTDLLLATVTNNNAPPGVVGEYISSEVVQGSSPGLSSGVALNVTTLTLTPGDWDIGGYVGFNPAASTSFTLMAGSLSTTSATQDASRQVRFPSPATVPGSQIEFAIPVSRLSLSASTTLYLVATAIFTVSTCGGYGRVYARRAR